jgi:hypothetical protein
MFFFNLLELDTRSNELKKKKQEEEVVKVIHIVP